MAAATVVGLALRAQDSQVLMALAVAADQQLLTAVVIKEQLAALAAVV